MLIYRSRVADTQHPGLAKFGIALEWGSRGRWFESSNSDQEHRIILHGSVFFLFLYYQYQLKAAESSRFCGLIIIDHLRAWGSRGTPHRQLPYGVHGRKSSRL